MELLCKVHNIEKYGLEEMIDWSNEIKVDRIMRLAEFLLSVDIESVRDIYDFYNSNSDAGKLLLQVNGIGEKTVDYLFMLVGGNAVAIDRHLKLFAEENSIIISNYESLRKIYVVAAQLMDISYVYLDKLVWVYMSNRKKLESVPLVKCNSFNDNKIY